MRHLARVALLDGDRRPVGEGQVERAGRGGDVERDAVGPGEQGHAVGPDLVGGVAVGGDPVGPDDDEVDLVLAGELFDAVDVGQVAGDVVGDLGGSGVAGPGVQVRDGRGVRQLPR